MTDLTNDLIGIEETVDADVSVDPNEIPEYPSESSEPVKRTVVSKSKKGKKERRRRKRKNKARRSDSSLKSEVHAKRTQTTQRSSTTESGSGSSPSTDGTAKAKKTSKDRGGFKAPGKPKPPLRVANHVTDDQRKMLEKVFPSRTIKAANKSGPHPHIVCRVVRSEGEGLILKALRKLGVGDIIDVGGSRRNSYRKDVHSVECGRDPRTIVKIDDWKRDFPDSYCKPEDNGRPKGSWSFCECKAQNCKHVNANGAMFIHSIYYNSPEDVAMILANTQYMTGYSLHHEFNEYKGEFYRVGDDFEARYRHLPDNQVEMTVEGNQPDCYRHSDLNWMRNRSSCLITGPQFDADYVLTWKLANFQVDATGCTPIYKFNLIEADRVRNYKEPSTNPELDEPIPTAPDFPEDPDIVLGGLSEAANSREFRHVAKRARIRWAGRHFLYCFYEKKPIMVPRRLVTEGLRFYIDHSIDPESHGDLKTYLKKLLLKPEFKDMANHAEMVFNIPVYADIIVEHTLDATSWSKKYYTLGKLSEINRHNELLKWDFYKMNLRKLLLIVSSLIGGTLLLGFAISTIWYAPWYVPAIFIACVVLGYFPAVSVLLFVLITQVNCQVGPVVATAGAGFFVTIFIAAVLLLCCCRQKWNNSAWKRFKRRVETFRRTCAAEGPVPLGAYIAEFETLMSGDAPQAEGSWVKKTPSHRKRVKKRGPGAFVLAIIFSIAAPLVFSTSAHNLLVSIKERVTVKPPEEAIPGYWAWATGFWNHDIYATMSGPRSFTETFEADKVFEQPVVTWGYYLSRFPKGKQGMILRAKHKMEQGLFHLSHFVYNAFVKREILLKITRAVYEWVKPRCIQGSFEGTKPASGVWFLRYSNALKFSMNPTTHVWYCSGYNGNTFNWWINFQMERLGMDCFFVGSDFSKYDVTQGRYCIEGEIEWYRKLGCGDLEFGAEILFSKVRTKGYGNGVKYLVWFTRKSGDNDTSSGNSRNTAIAMVSFFEGVLGLKPSQYAIAVLGDDNFSLVQKSAVDMTIVRPLMIEHMKKLGFSVKVIVTSDIMKAEFLSRRFYPVGDKYVIGKKPGRVLCKLGYTVSNTRKSRETHLSEFKGTLLSMLGESSHVPFLRKYVKICLEQLTTVKAVFKKHQELKLKGEAHEPTKETFVAFEELYGLGRGDEFRFEAKLRRAVKRWGLMCILNSDAVEEMLRVDQSGGV